MDSLHTLSFGSASLGLMGAVAGEDVGMTGERFWRSFCASRRVSLSVAFSLSRAEVSLDARSECVISSTSVSAHERVQKHRVRSRLGPGHAVLVGMSRIARSGC